MAFAGFVSDRAELARALASSDIYVSAMADETFGVSIIEAQAAGLPVVGVASGAMPLRVDPMLGLLGPVDDTSAMAANVVRIWAGDPAAMGRAARRHVEANFSWERTFARLFDDIYPKALAAGSGAGGGSIPMLVKPGAGGSARRGIQRPIHPAEARTLGCHDGCTVHANRRTSRFYGDHTG